jgi:monovalent cation:H+ antiporter-2, CPA2 family
MSDPMTLLALSGPSVYVLNLLAVLATAAVVAIAMQRMRLAAIPAYLVAGAIAGPGALGLVQSAETLESIANLAIVLLMFGIGLHLHLTVLGSNLGRMVAAGVSSCALSIATGWPVAMLFGLSAPAALALCMALSLSSTAVVLRLITDRGELRHATGQLALSILVVQDIAVLAMLAAFPAIARWASSANAQMAGIEVDVLEDWGVFFRESGIRIGGIALIIVVGKFALPRILREAARGKSGEVMMIVSVAIAIGAGVAAQALGFSMELGAFLAGFLLSNTIFRHQLSGQIAPLRDLFMAVFFTTLGMRLQPAMFVESWWIILVGGAVMTLLKAISIGLVCWSLGATAAAAVAVGIALAQGGEFSLVLIGAARDQNILTETQATNTIAIVVISLIFTPALVEIGARFAKRWCSFKAAPWIRTAIDHRHEQAQPRVHEEDRRIIVGGYGQVGHAIGQALQELKIRYTVIEVDPDRAHAAAGAGCNILFGDVSNTELLESAEIDQADALILTMPNESAVLAACAVARRRNPRLFIVARMELERHSRQAHEVGANVIVVEELQTALAMRDAVLNHFNSEIPHQKQAPSH